jgi:hypothetical protein
LPCVVDWALNPASLEISPKWSKLHREWIVPGRLPIGYYCRAAVVEPTTSGLWLQICAEVTKRDSDKLSAWLPSSIQFLSFVLRSVMGDSK